jgi:DGQHR domain-containing protein
MNAEVINSGNIEYLKLELEEFKQKSNSFYLAKIKAFDFLKIFTVRPAEYDLQKHTALAGSFPDETTYYEHLINEDKKRINQKDFQREPDATRISKIQKFISEEEYAFFPNTIISNCELINDLENFSLDENSNEIEFFNTKNKPATTCFFNRVSDRCYLYVPNKPNTILVIDGQHRLEGLQRAAPEVQKNYDLLIAFIIGFDRSVIAKQFYTINYEQKSVNKSLLYQLTGEFSHDLDELTFMHNLVKLLNELTDSPFYGRVKMLGKTPKNVTQDLKDRLSISQAFLIDSSIRLISSNAIGTTMPPIFLKYFKNKDEHINIIKTIARFFNAVEKIKPDWNTPKESIISKGMGVTALLRVLNLIFPIIFVKEMNEKWENIELLKVQDFQRFLKGLENVDFSSDGPYGKTGSGGSISKIKSDILSKLEYIGIPQDLDEFESKFRISYLNRFNTSLTNALSQFKG